jgi:hypothetical protein
MVTGMNASRLLVCVLGIIFVGAAGCPVTPVADEPAPSGPVDAGPELSPCFDDEQCGADRFCRAGFCSDAQCRNKGECASSEICLDERCAPPPERCAGPDDCPGTQLCDGFSDLCF